MRRRSNVPQRAIRISILIGTTWAIGCGQKNDSQNELWPRDVVPEQADADHASASNLAAMNNMAKVLLPSEKLFGRDQGQLVWRYFNHILTVPFGDLFTRYPDNAHRSSDLFPLRQRGDIWILGDAWKDDGFGRDIIPPIVRHVTVPQGKGLVMPFISAAGIELQGSHADVRAANTALQEDLISFAAWVDGKPVPSDAMFAQWRSSYKPMDPFTADNVVGDPSLAGQAVRMEAQGSVLRLAPLPLGTHSIRVVACDNSGFQWDVTHEVAIVPATPEQANDHGGIAFGPGEEGTYLRDNALAEHVQGLAFFWGNAAKHNSLGGKMVTEDELNNVVSLALSDSKTPGRIDADERRAITRAYEAGLKNNADSAARGVYDALFNGKYNEVDVASLVDALAQGVYTYGEYGEEKRELSKEEFQKVIVAALTNRRSPNAIDASERNAINRLFSDLPAAGRNPTEPGSRAEANHSSPEAQYLYDALKAGGAL